MRKREWKEKRMWRREVKEDGHRKMRKRGREEIFDERKRKRKSDKEIKEKGKSEKIWRKVKKMKIEMVIEKWWRVERFEVEEGKE